MLSHRHLLDAAVDHLSFHMATRKAKSKQLSCHEVILKHVGTILRWLYVPGHENLVQREVKRVQQLIRAVGVWRTCSTHILLKWAIDKNDKWTLAYLSTLKWYFSKKIDIARSRKGKWTGKVGFFMTKKSYSLRLKFCRKPYGY